MQKTIVSFVVGSVLGVFVGGFAVEAIFHNKKVYSWVEPDPAGDGVIEYIDMKLFEEYHEREKKGKESIFVGRTFGKFNR